MITRNSRASKRWMVAAAAAVACGSTLAISGAASAGPGAAAPVPERISGDNRFGTAAAVSEDLNNDANVVLVNGLNFPDGLASAVFGDSILLTGADALPTETADELERLELLPGPIDVTIVGGTSVVSSAVLEDVAGIVGTTPTRLSGANRYATAIAVAEANIARFGASGTVVLATGENFPDALAAGPLANAFNAPILLNSGDTVRSDVAEFLLDPANGVTNVIIVGGTTVVPASVATQLSGSLGLTVDRLAGSNRAGTAVEIADELGWTGGVTAVNGNSFADALAAGPYASANAYPILLVNQDSIPAPTADFHVANCQDIAFITAIGGPAVISDAVVEGAVGAATCSAPAIASATLLNNNFVQYEGAISGTLTVEAVAGSPADGAVANAWQVAFIQNGTPGTEAVVVDPEGDDDPAYGGVPTFIMTANFGGLTDQGFLDIWNSSPAAALVTASTTDPAAIVPIVGAAAPGVPAVPLTAIFTTLGSQDSVVAVTFERAVTAATPSGLYPNLNPLTPATLLAPTSTSTIPLTGATTVTYTWEDVTTAVPSLPNYQIRFAAGSITDAATGFTNLLPAAATLTAP